MNTKIGFYKYIFICALGFGLGGLLWGLVLYSELPDLEFPFHYLGIISMAFFGGGTIGLFFDSFKDIVKAILAGLIGWTIGVTGVWVFGYPLYLYGALSLTPLCYIVEVEFLNKIINLDPNIGIGDFWLMFLIIGVILGFFYAIFLKIKIWPLVWRAGLGLALGSLIGPVIGNLIGNYFDSVLLSYLITFSLMGIILGKFLGWGIYGKINT